MQAILDKVIIRQEGKNMKKSASGIYLPDSSREKRPGYGRILSIGEGVTCGVKVGQLVKHVRWEGTEVKDPENPNAEPLLVLKEEHLLAVIEEEND